IHAEGLAALERIAGKLSDDVWVAAPEHEQSGASRALTLSDPLRVRRLGPKRFAISGTPTDCVMLAMEELIEGARPDLVLSGVNRGHNVAEDVTMSGTVAGAIQGMALGARAIALSQALAVFHDDEVARYDTAEAFAPGVIHRLLTVGWPKDVVLNMNFPNRRPDEVEAVEVTRQGFRDLHNTRAEKRTDLRWRDYYWMGFTRRRPNVAEGTDIAAVLGGRISVTPLHIDLTHQPTVRALKAVLGGAPPKLDTEDR
ncbi:MAG: 5'/3'-nucleotidase SurE, partial [Solirubrobacteraceae bacterium]